MIFSSLDLTTMYLIRASVSIVPLLPQNGRLGCKRLVTSKKNKQTKQNKTITLIEIMQIKVCFDHDFQEKDYAAY